FAGSKSARMRERAASFMVSVACPECGGRRLKGEALAVTFEGLAITELAGMPLDDVAALLQGVLEPDWRPRGGGDEHPEQLLAARRLVSDLLARLAPIVELGLGSLSLDRTTSSLSSGELQRMRLATQVLSQLFGVVFVLDEPSAGLHPADTESLLRILATLRDTGNTVYFVEHSLDVIRQADWIVDIGPGAGSEGGTVVYSGALEGLRHASGSVTRDYLFPEPGSQRAVRTRRSGDERLELSRVSRHNVRDLTVAFPLGALTAVTGVSGSGKSSLVVQALPDLLQASLASEVDEHASGADEPADFEDPLSQGAEATTSGRARGPRGRLRRI